MRDKAKDEAVSAIVKFGKPETDPKSRVESLLQFFSISPNNMDPKWGSPNGWNIWLTLAITGLKTKSSCWLLLLTRNSYRIWETLWKLRMV